jgi:hypothetical protein
MANYTQKTIANIKKGEKFSMVSFTGMNLGQYEVTAVSKNQFKAVKTDGTELIFNKKDGEQANANNPKYANKAVDLMEAPERKVPAAKPATKTEKPAGKTKPETKTETKEQDAGEDFEGEESGDDGWEEA